MKMKGGVHQSLLTLIRTLACLHKKGVGLGGNPWQGQMLHGQGFGGLRKDWGGMGEYYHFEGNGGWCCRLTLESGSQSQTVRLGAGLFSNIWYISLCRKTSTSA